MTVNIVIKYPNNSVASQEEIEALKKLEDCLTQKLVAITLTTYETYQWFLDTSVKSQRYFGLKNNNGVVFSKSINEIKNTKPEDFVHGIETEAVFQKHK